MSSFQYMNKAQIYDMSEVFFVRIDPYISNREAFISSISYQMWFPGYFGFNWDALYNCLNDLSWIKLHKIVIFHEKLPCLSDEEVVKYIKLLNDIIVEFSSDDRHDLEVIFPTSAASLIQKAIA